MLQSRRWTSSGPVEYAEIGPIFDLIRTTFLAAGVLGLIGAALVLGTHLYVLAVVLAVWGVVQALYRRANPSSSALLPLATDVTIIGLVALSVGVWPGYVISASAYILVIAVLLLPPLAVMALLGYAAVWFLAAHTAGLDLTPEFSFDWRYDAMSAVVFLGITAVSLMGVARTLRQRRRREQDALEAERRAGEIKSEFVSMVSHELRTPLTSIAGFAETLRESWRSLQPGEVDEFLGIVSDQAEHLANLVEDILVIPRLDAGKLRLHSHEFDLSPLLRRLVEIHFPPSARKQVGLFLPATGARVLADPMRVEQVLRNLLDNAHKYGGEEITIEVKKRHAALQVAVIDNGEGIPEADQERIFEHFEQVSKGDARTYTGVGLGLPIARKLVRAMGGELWFEPRFPHGSCFAFTLVAAGERPDAEGRRMRRSA